MIMEKEIWKDIKGYTGYYQISSSGRVKSCERTIIQNNGRFHNRKERILTPHSNKNTSYLQVMLVVHKRIKLCYIHRLVCEAFVENPNPDEYKFVTHINGDIQDNRAENLAWVSKSQNKNKRLGLYGKEK